MRPVSAGPWRKRQRLKVKAALPLALSRQNPAALIQGLEAQPFWQQQAGAPAGFGKPQGDEFRFRLYFMERAAAVFCILIAYAGLDGN